MSAPTGRPTDPVEDYLDQLLLTLTGTPRRIRHTLSEVEAHLDDAVAAGRSAGLSDEEARRAAVRNLGSVEGVAAPPTRQWATRPSRRRMLLGLLLVTGVGGIAVGVAGLLAAVVRAVGGDRLVGAPFPTGSYTAGDCARWLANYPGAHGCLSAMTQDHADDFLRNTAAAGVLGLLALGAYLVIRRRWWNQTVAAALPRWVEWVVGAGLAGAAAVVLSAQGADAILVEHGTGAGASLSLAGAAAAAAAGFAVAARRAVQRPLAQHSGDRPHWLHEHR